MPVLKTIAATKLDFSGDRQRRHKLRLPRASLDLCHGILFVVRAGETDHEAAKKASIESREKNLLSGVLNQLENSEVQSGYYCGHSDKP